MAAQSVGRLALVLVSVLELARELARELMRELELVLVREALKE